MCFRASCSVKGNKSMSLSIDDIKSKLAQDIEKPLLLSDCTGWTQNIKSYPQVMEYLIKNNCLDAYDAYPNRFFYDRVKNRVVFVEYEGLNSFKLATGRSLCGASPKWHKYVSMQGAFFLTKCLSSDKVLPTVIVEDCASACSVGRIANAVSLCGTYINLSSLLIALHGVQDVIVSLDADALLKSLKLQRDLLGAGKFRSVRVVTPRDDFKYLQQKEIFGLLYEGEIYDETSTTKDKAS